MTTKIESDKRYGHQKDGFGIQILYPGIVRPELKDTGFATLGRIDHATIIPGTLIPMHPHKNDEILTYLRSGEVKHIDSEGHTGIISNQKLMMMNAGSKFSHEELTLVEAGILNGLQIFIRPKEKGLKPQVQFYSLPEIYSLNKWRKLAGEGKDYPLEIRSATWLQDVRIEKGKTISLPEAPEENLAFLLYVFDGSIKTNNDILLNTCDSLLIENETPVFEALKTSDVIVFMTKTNSEHFDDGMYSGNKI